MQLLNPIHAQCQTSPFKENEIELGCPLSNRVIYAIVICIFI